MLSCALRTLLVSTIPVVLAACSGAHPAAATPTLGIDLGRSGVIQSAAASAKGEGHEILPPTGGTRAQSTHNDHGEARATGMVNSVDVAARRVNVSHGPIPSLGWPPMTMDFPVAPLVDMRALKPGSRVNFTLGKGSDGMPVVDTIAAAGGVR